MVVVCMCIFERFTVLMVYLLIKLEALGNFALVKPGILHIHLMYKSKSSHWTMMVSYSCLLVMARFVYITQFVSLRFSWDLL